MARLPGWMFLIKKATAIANQAGMLGIHVWYDRTAAEAVSPRKAEPVEFGIDVHGQIAAAHSREYIEAVVTDALRILPTYDRTDTLVVINPRKVGRAPTSHRLAYFANIASLQKKPANLQTGFAP